MKINYLDTPENEDLYLADHPECRVRAIFNDDGNIFVFYSHGTNIYINRVSNPAHQPHMFFLSNLEVIKDDAQFDYYYERLNAVSNYQGLHKGEEIWGDQ